jgi:AcrR family transcriptional regulator
MVDDPAPSLDGRARNKLATRRALRQATLELAIQHGFAHVTVEQIARRAGVSTRTFFNYFDTKEDAAVVELFRFADDGLAVIAKGPADGGGDVWKELTALFVADVERVADEGPDLPRYMTLHRDEPALQIHQQGRLVTVIERITRAVERRLGDGPSRRLRAGLMAGSCITAARVGLGEWARDGWPGSPAPYVAAAFAAFDDAFARGG